MIDDPFDAERVATVEAKLVEAEQRAAKAQTLAAQLQEQVRELERRHGEADRHSKEGVHRVAQAEAKVAHAEGRAEVLEGLAKSAISTTERALRAEERVKALGETQQHLPSLIQACLSAAGAQQQPGWGFGGFAKGGRFTPIKLEFDGVSKALPDVDAILRASTPVNGKSSSLWSPRGMPLDDFGRGPIKLEFDEPVKAGSNKGCEPEVANDAAREEQEAVEERAQEEDDQSGGDAEEVDSNTQSTARLGFMQRAMGALRPSGSRRELKP